MQSDNILNNNIVIHTVKLTHTHYGALTGQLKIKKGMF